jgi:hypothetical protein
MGEAVENPDVCQARRIAVGYGFIGSNGTQLDQFNLTNGNRVDKFCNKLDRSNVKILFDTDLV